MKDGARSPGGHPVQCLSGLGSKNAIFFHYAAISNGPDRAVRPPSALLTLLMAHFMKLDHGYFKRLFQVLQ